MAKLGINIKIDVKKIDKSRLFQGEKGLYLDLNTFIDTDGVGDYGDHGMVTQRVTKEEREQKIKMPILGNSRVYFTDLNPESKVETASAPPSSYKASDDDAPF